MKLVMKIRTIAIFLVLAAATSASAQPQPTPKESEPGRGIGVDSRGGQVIDPTENVKALSEAASKRQDDLRDLGNKLIDEKIKANDMLNQLRYEHNKDLREAESRRLDQQAVIRAEYDDKLRQAEAKRIDAIRTVDVSAVATATARATDQASVLATQVNQSAEALRALVASTAAAVAASQQQLANSLSARITTLEQAGYQQAGKQTISDPAFVALVAKVETLVAAKEVSGGTSAGRSDVVGWIAAALMFLVAVAGVAVGFVRKNGS